MTVRKLNPGQLSYHDVSIMMAEIFKKMKDDRKNFSVHTIQQSIKYLKRDLAEIKYLRAGTSHSLINMFLDEYEKSVKAEMEEIKNG